MSPSSSQVPLFEQVKRKFDIHRLQSDLEAIGQVDPRDWEFLKGVLCGLDQGEIAKQCHVEKETVKVALSRRVRLHILHLFPDKKNVDWKRLPGWLIEAGYGIGENHRVNWQQVCRTMLDRQKKLSTNEVIASEAMQFDLLDDEIFISLALVERKEPERLSQNVYPARPIEQYEEKPPIEYEQFREQILRQGKSDRIAIIGEPGAGKTTLLQHIAFWILDKELGLPIWISLGDLIKNGDLQRLKDYLTQVWLDDAMSNVVTQDVKSDFLKQLNEQRVWLLLDGADEIVASSGIALREINNQLRGWLSQSCIILTCRINVWEVDINALRDFQTYRTKEFHYPTQVERFIESGFRKSNQQSGERLKTELANTERTRLQQLVRNPLRLMMLCTTWHEQESLPATKAELYKRFVSEFYKWNRSKWKNKDLNYAFFPNTVAKQEKLNKALGRLACRALDEESSPFRLPHNLVSDELGDPDEDGSDFWLALNLGWLQVARDSDKPSNKVYTFFHPTFQEYFAACAIDDWRNDNPMQGIYRIFEPQWKEVILLWLGRDKTEVSDEQKEEFIQALVEFKDGCGGFYEFRAYLLAAAGIAEFGKCTRANEIVNKLLKWGLDNKAFFNPMARSAKLALQETNRTVVSNALIKLLDPSQDKLIQHHTAEVIGESGINDLRLIEALTHLMNKTLYKDTRCVAARSLVSINPGDSQEAIDALIQLLYDDWHLSCMAASYLGEVGVGKLDVIEALTELVDRRWSEFEPCFQQDVRQAAASSLLKINPGNSIAIKALTDLMINHWNDIMRHVIAQQLKENGIGSPKVTDVITNFQNPIEEDLLKQLANLNLGQFDPDDLNLEVINDIAKKVIEILSFNQDKNTCENASWCLEIIFLGEPFGIQSNLYSEVVAGLKHCPKALIKENYKILWHCAQNMPYPDFYQSWQPDNYS